MASDDWRFANFCRVKCRRGTRANLKKLCDLGRNPPDGTTWVELRDQCPHLEEFKTKTRPSGNPAAGNRKDGE